jgi:hypothetical protein
MLEFHLVTLRLLQILEYLKLSFESQLFTSAIHHPADALFALGKKPIAGAKKLVASCS